ncbi:MAG: peptidylprolyl isomerase [Clostridiales bacterium]|nr:peptidylprolyl isomerase [Clostridiales bacterium]
MDDKEKELLPEQDDDIKTEIDVDNIDVDDVDDNAENVDSDADDSFNPDDGLEEKDGVKYETNDNWTFDAEAPTLNDDFVIENENLKIDLSEDKKMKKEENIQPKSEPDVYPQSNSNSVQISINKSTVQFTFLAIFLAAVIAVMVVLGVRYYTVPNGKEGDKMNPASVVATIGDQKVSIGMFNYYYSSIVSYYEQYAAYGYFDLDTTADYSTQYTTDEDGNSISWQEFFENTALDEVRNVTAYYDAAVKSGVTLTDAQQETIDTQMESLETSASESGVSLNEYIETNFGQYCSEDTLRLMLEQYYVSANYKGIANIETAQGITDEDIDTYFSENSSDFYSISFDYLAIEYDTTSDDTMAESEATAQEYMEKMTDSDAIKELAAEVYADYIESDAASLMESDSTLSEEDAIEQATESYTENITASITGTDTPFDDEFNTWLFSSDTEIGSTNYYIDESSGYIYIVYKSEEAVLDEDETYTVRHILIQPESEDEDEDSDDTTTSDDSDYTEEEWAAAKEEAEKIYEEYTSGEQTETAFAALAEKYSEDTASTSSGSSDVYGGLYEGTALDTMVSEFEDWSVDDSRQYGDTEIIQTDYGYHIMFFINDCPSYESSIISAIKDEKLESIVENTEYKVNQNVIDKAVTATAEADSETTTTDE